jgi:hypothetical protein
VAPVRTDGSEECVAPISRVEIMWSSGQNSWLQTQRPRVRFPSLPNFLSSSESGTGAHSAS